MAVICCRCFFLTHPCVCLPLCGLCVSCVFFVSSSGRVDAGSSTMFELLRRQKLDLLGAHYADNVNDGMRGNVFPVPTCARVVKHMVQWPAVSLLASLWQAQFNF